MADQVTFNFDGGKVAVSENGSPVILNAQNWKGYWQTYLASQAGQLDNGEMFTDLRAFQDAASVGDTYVSDAANTTLKQIENADISFPGYVGSFQQLGQDIGDSISQGIKSVTSTAVGSAVSGATGGLGDALNQYAWIVLIAAIGFTFVLAYLPKKGSRA